LTMGWRKKSFQKKVSQRNPYAKELEEGQYRQRIKESDKDYKRQKLNIRNIDERDEEDDTSD
jgi:hypothetical protein